MKLLTWKYQYHPSVETKSTLNNWPWLIVRFILYKYGEINSDNCVAILYSGPDGKPFKLIEKGKISWEDKDYVSTLSRLRQHYLSGGWLL